MAFILHGEGLWCLKTVHHHHRHNCSSHSPKNDQMYHNNNKTKFEYRPLINESKSADKNGAKNLWNTSLPNVKRGSIEHHETVCTSRSPGHSRSNSLSRYGYGHSSNGNDMIRRNSHTTAPLSTSAASIKIKEMIDSENKDCHDIELNDEQLLITSVDDTICVRGCVSNGSAICPRHHYVHRDSSEHTPITSSDSEDMHDHHHHHNHHHHHHQHRHSLANHLHSNHSRHSHDFSTKNINIQAAVIHVIGDFVQSIGVFISAIIIKNYVSWTLTFKLNHKSFQCGFCEINLSFIVVIHLQPNAKIADPVCTFIFSIIVMMTTCTIMKDSIGILLEAVPNSINTERLRNDLRCIDGVKYVVNPK